MRSASTASWQRLCTSTELQRSSHVVSVIDKIALIFGGELLPRQPRDNDVFSLNHKDTSAPLKLSTNSDAPPPRVGTASATLNGKFYIFSGRGGVAMAPLDEQGGVWEFDPSSSTWTFLPPSDISYPLPEARSYHCSTSDGRDTIYIHAGCPEKGRLADMWSFRVSERMWKRLADAPAPARGGSSVAFADGLVYRMNGFDGKTEQGGSLDVYDPNSDSWSSKTFSADGVGGPAPRSVSALLSVTVGGKKSLVTLFGEHDPSSLGHAGAGKMLDDVWRYDIAAGDWEKVDVRGDGPPARGWFDADVFGEDGIFVVGGLGETNERLGDAWLLRW